MSMTRHDKQPHVFVNGVIKYPYYVLKLHRQRPVNGKYDDSNISSAASGY